MAANDIQVAGGHYRMDGEQHWDRQWKLHGRGYFVGCITKYVERYDKKNGIQDLEKAKHFLEKLIELEKASTETVKFKATVRFDERTQTIVGELPLEELQPEEPGKGYVKQD